MEAESGLVVEDAESGFCGAVVGLESGAVVLEWLIDFVAEPAP